MNYEEKYKLALSWATFYNSELPTKEQRKMLEVIFPELQENEDERIRKVLLNDFKNNCSEYYCEGVNRDMIIAWLEKQGEPSDKVEPKFHEGDWIISNNKKSIYQVIEVKRGIYVIRDNVDNHEYHIGIEECEKSGRLFTIQDAKDGDVLASGQVVFIFKVIRDGWLYCHYSFHNDGSLIAESYDMMTYKYFGEVHPATKEQRDLLFSKMKEDGYEWDADKKELKKIEPKKLDPDKVIEWIDEHVPTKFEDMQNYVNQFKKDFGI